MKNTVFQSTRILTPQLYDFPHQATSQATNQELRLPPAQPISFVEAIFQGLAPDGGLYYPTSYNTIFDSISQCTVNTSFIELAAKVTHALFPLDFSEQDALALCQRAFPFEPQLQLLDESLYLLELFHGPSCAFKDFGASYLAAIMERSLTQSSKHITILTATSGDTGSAVAQAFHNKKNITVVILFPSKRVSPLQEKQLTGVGDNVYALEVLGTFDDCQHMVKSAFQHDDLREEHGLSSANSINIGRLIPQAMYYMYAWNILRHQNVENWAFCTPSGNFGNLTAGLLAKRWGLPFGHFIAASNANKVVPEYLAKGTYSPHPSIDTLANAMDVGNPSNFERMLTMYAGLGDAPNIPPDVSSDISKGQLLSTIHQKMREELYGVSIDDAAIREEIKTTFDATKQYICPHTAVGVQASKRALDKNNPQSLASQFGYDKAVVLSTAHAGKFFEIIEKATDTTVPLPDRLEQFLHRKTSSVKIEATLEALANSLASIKSNR